MTVGIIACFVVVIIGVFILAGIFLMCACESKTWIFDPNYKDNKRLRARIKELENELSKQDGFFK